MAINLKKYKDALLFLPLGGSGEIGMNLNLYHLNGKWLIADFGAGFAEDFLPGVDMIVPDISFLYEQREHIVGCMLTHAHEDHLGAIPFLWETLRFPIYATPFTAAFLKAKLDGEHINYSKKIHEVTPGERVDIGPFSIDLISLTHSVPEMNAIVLRTPYGNILHTGDWKLDPDPIIGPVSDEKKLKRYGKEGILAMVCDSTNVFTPGTSGSEGQLRKSLTKQIKACTNLVVVTTFASNITRLETVAKAAEASGRQVILAGRSLWRIAQAAKDAGYLKDCPPLLEDSAFKRFSRDKLVVLATGCQGEPKATVAKMANNAHPMIRLVPEDTVIFASKIIPGNEKRIFRLFNAFVRNKIEVKTEKQHFVHVSGHPCRDELERMYALARPQIAIPVHGEDMHIHEHAKLARSLGIKHVIEVQNGTLVKLAPGTPEKIGQVECPILGVDGKSLRSPQSDVMRSRRRMRSDGVIAISILIKGNKLHGTPAVVGPGVLEPKEDDDIEKSIIDQIAREINDAFKQPRKVSVENIKNIGHKVAKRVIKQDLGKEPLIRVMVEDLG